LFAIRAHKSYKSRTSRGGCAAFGDTGIVAIEPNLSDAAEFDALWTVEPLD